MPVGQTVLIPSVHADPAGHATQSDALASEYVVPVQGFFTPLTHADPAGQGEHTEAAASAYVDPRQIEQELEPAAEIVPTGHAAHDVVPATISPW